MPPPPSLATTLCPTPHATAVVAVLALYAVLRTHVLASGSTGAATMREWEPMAAAAAAAAVAARVMSAAGRPGGSGLHTLAAALPIAGRVAQLTAASLLLTASPAAGAWLVVAAGTAAALVPAEPAFAPGSAADAALPATTPAAAADAAKPGSDRPYVLLLYDPAGGARAAVAVAALARLAAGRSEQPAPPVFRRLDAARWPEAAATLAGGGGEEQKVDVDRITERLKAVVHDSVAGGGEGQEKPIAVVGKEALTIIRRFQRTDKTNRKVLISEDAIKSVFHLPISKAAAELGVGLTVLKKYCRVYSISRWPFRKLKSLDKLVSTVAAINDLSSVDTRSAVAQGLVNKKLAMELMPSIELDTEIKRIRQAAYKLEHKKRCLSNSSSNAIKDHEAPHALEPVEGGP